MFDDQKIIDTESIIGIRLVSHACAIATRIALHVRVVLYNYFARIHGAICFPKSYSM